MIRRLPFVALLALTLAALPARAATASCPDSNPPNELVLVAGSLQTAQLGHPFGTTLAVALANTNGCPVNGQLAGASVAFSAPGSGASGTFAGGGTSTITVSTDSSGRAVAPVFTANDTAGQYVVHASSGYGGVDFTLVNSGVGIPVSIAASGGAGQSAQVNGRYAQPLTARVLDGAGNPVQGAEVAFTLSPSAYGAGGTFLGGGAQTSAVTNASGVATSPLVVANDTPGPFTATASTGGVVQPAAFPLSNTVATVTLAAQERVLAAAVGSTYTKRLRVKVLDAAGNPVVGAAVVFALEAAHSGAGGVFLGGATQTTAYADGDGIATSPAVVANTSAGTFGASASVAGAAATSFALRNTAGQPASLSAGAAAMQSAHVHSRFPVRLAVTVTDANGNPVPGAVVTFTAPKRGAGGRFVGGRVARATTDADGVAVAPALRANGTSGGFVVV
ncbi:MAG: Ig-like domain-containing protein, partial [Actinomycetota bacterium]